MVVERTRVVTVSIFDMVVAILILVASFFAIIAGAAIGNMVGQYGYYMAKPMSDAFSAVSWIAIISGIAGIAYGIKRLVDDVLHVAVRP
jgi:hypothetical protein